MNTPSSALIRLVYPLVRRGAPLMLAALLLGCNGQLGGSTDDMASGDGEDAGTHYVPPDLLINKDAFWAADPPPMYCAPDGGTGMPPPIPGGTPECPDDKNRQGCPCPTEGETKACWPGLRANRGLGICLDGTTTCVRNGEFGYVWGACQNYVLPIPGETTGSTACKCFSAGRWAIDNVVPCFYTSSGSIVGTTSSVLMGGKPTCMDMSGAIKPPSQPWSPNSIKVDCAGHWKLCYTLKAGDAKNPLPTDCTIAKVCTEGNYLTANEMSMLPILPAWAATSAAEIACATKFNQSGGYGEMSVDGTSITCDRVSSVFNRLNYCPASCQTDPTTPECKSCVNGGSGSF